MTVSVAVPNLTGVSGAITCIRKARLNAPSIFGSTDIYFILTASGHLYYTLDIINNAPIEISLANIPFVATSFFTGMDVFTASNGPGADVTYPVVILYGVEETGLAFDGGTTPLKQFVAALKCGGIPAQPPTVGIEWLGNTLLSTQHIDSQLGRWVPTPTPLPSWVQADYFGYVGGDVPGVMALGSAQAGLVCIPAAEFGQPRSTVDMSHDFSAAWRTEVINYVFVPGIHIVPNVDFQYPHWEDALFMSSFGMIFPWMLFRDLKPDGTLGALRLKAVYGNLDGHNPPSAVSGVMIDALKEGLSIGRYEDAANSYDLMAPFSSADYDWIAAQPDPMTVAVTWGLSGSDPITNFVDQRIYGSVSVAWVSKTGAIRVFGDGAGEGQFATPEGACAPAAICFGTYGLFQDPACSGLKGVPPDTPFYNDCVLGINGQYLMRSPDGLDWSAAPVLTLPPMVPNSPVYSASLQFLNRYSGNLDLPTGPTRAYVLAVIFESADPATTGHIIGNTYYSLDGISWELFDSYDFTDLSFPNYTSPSVISQGVHAYVNASSIHLNVPIQDVVNGVPTNYMIVHRWYNGGEYYFWDTTEVPVGDSSTFVGGLRSYDHTNLVDYEFMFGTAGNSGFVLKSTGFGAETPVLSGVPCGVDLFNLGFHANLRPEWTSAEFCDDIAASHGGFLGFDALYSVVSYFSSTDFNGYKYVPTAFCNTRFGLMSFVPFDHPDNPLASSHVRLGEVSLSTLEASYGVWGFAYPSTTDQVNTYRSGFTTSFVYTEPDKGTLVFLKNAEGATTHVMLTSPQSAQHISIGTSVEIPYDTYLYWGLCWAGFYPLGFMVNDIFAHSSNVAFGSPSSLYLCSTDGDIWVLSPGRSFQLSKVSSYFSGKQNLRLANANGVWIVSYDGLDPVTGAYVNTCIEYSLDLATWQVGIGLGGSSAPGMVAKSADILPLGSAGNMELLLEVPAGYEGNPAFYNQIP